MREINLTLTLLMLGILADNPDHALTTNDLAVITDPFDRCSDFHWLIAYL